MDEQRQLEKTTSVLSEAMRYQTSVKELREQETSTFLLGQEKLDKKTEKAVRKDLRNLILRDALVQDKLREVELDRVQSALAETDQYMEKLIRTSQLTGKAKLKHDFFGNKRTAAKKELDSIQSERQRIARERQGVGEEDPENRSYETARERKLKQGRHRHNPFRAICNSMGLGTKEERHAALDDRRADLTIKAAPGRVALGRSWTNILEDESACLPLEIQSTGGILRGSMYTPTVAQKVHRVVIVYTGTGGPSCNQAPPIADAYLKQGATVITADYRGFGASESRKEGKKCRTHLCEDSIYRDGRDVYDYVRSMGYDPGEIILHGFSLGGAVASRVAAEIAEENAAKDQTQLAEKDRLGGLVLHSSIASMKKAANAEMKGSGNIARAASGAYDTEAHMRRLRQLDPYLPVHYRGGGQEDQLSLRDTNLHKDPRARFFNTSSAELSDSHCDPLMDNMNMGAQLESLGEMVKNGRAAKLSPA